MLVVFQTYAVHCILYATVSQVCEITKVICASHHSYAQQYEEVLPSIDYCRDPAVAL